jgi:GNAT superfamily N-acetyltransferase
LTTRVDHDDLELVGMEQCSQEEILELYRVVFAERFEPLSRRYRWQYRLGFAAGVEPLLVRYQGRLVGQAGMLPVRMRIDGESRQAIWFVDFALVPEMQRQGIGQLLARRWCEAAPVQITIGPETSLGVFRKLGWSDDLKPQRFALPLRLDRVARSTGRSGLSLLAFRGLAPVYAIYRMILAWRGPQLEVRPLAECIDNLPESLTCDDPVAIERDREWITWRFKESPSLDQYLSTSLGAVTVLFRCFSHRQIRRVNILHVSGGSDREVESALRGLIRWCNRNQVDLVWAIASSAQLTRIYDRLFPFRSGVRFAYHTSSEAMTRRLAETTLSLQACDSDLDTMLG